VKEDSIMGNTLWQSLCDGAETMARDALKDVRTLDGWKRMRSRRHKEFMRSMGLDPLPEKCDLRVTEYGVFSGQGFRGRRIGFQILADCWTSACVYYPERLREGRLPAVLYVCGHGGIGTLNLQFHPIMWARRGYVCLIVDTIEQNDNPGEHHGQEVGKMDAWVSMGYTAAGGEMWNAIRALDVLAEDPKVDPERLAVTGISGGGACSFHLAVADERIKAVSTLCGISTPSDAIGNRHLISHCNCIYPNNVYRRDTSEFAALIAPRAALFCNADDDMIFHADKVSAMVERTRKVYGLYGRKDLCKLVTCPGGHGDHPEFTEATSRWFDKHVAGRKHPLVELGGVELAEKDISVFNGCPPSPNRLELLPQLVSPRGTVRLPETRADWKQIRRQALDALPPFPGDDGNSFMKQTAVWRVSNGTTEEHRGQIEGVDLWMYVLTPAKSRPKLVLGIAGPGGGARDILGDLYGCMAPGAAACGGLEPRLGGLTSLAPDKDVFSIRKLFPFAFPLTGSTPVMMTSHDIGVAVDYLFGLKGMKGCEIYLYGKGDAGVAALYRGLVDERIAGVILENAPSSHLDGAPILGILRAFDMPQAVGLMAPRKVALANPAHHDWTWPSRVYDRLGCPERLILADTLREALKAILT
jgi:dienelactone hydrolase